MEQKVVNQNLRIFNARRSVPETAKKKIIGGKLKGMTNINPMFRIEALTELFGPCGYGWRMTNISYWTTEGVGECVVWCSLDLYVKDGERWSEPINGIGGSKLYGKGQGDGINDEAYKMAQTDALSVACKNLGFAADVYYGLDDTKYRGEMANFQWGAPQQMQSPQPVSQPHTQPPVTAPSVQDAIARAAAAKTAKELTAVWNEYKGVYGSDPGFKKAVKDNPNNPKKTDKR